MSGRSVSLLFLIAAIYDGGLGLVFLFAGSAMFRWFDVTPPNHFGYVHFPAALLIVFAMMFFNVAKAPFLNRNLIPFGMLMKLSYCGVVGFHWFAAGIPNMWKPFAVFDLVFLILFAWAYVSLGKKASREEANQG